MVGPYDVPTGGIPLQEPLAGPAERVDAGAGDHDRAAGPGVLGRVHARDPRYPSYVALVAVFTSAMGLVVTADDLFVLLVGWEVMGACSYFLIGHHWELELARSGAVKAFLMTRLVDVGLLFGIFVAGNAADTYRISGVVAARSMEALPAATPPPPACCSCAV